MSKGKEFHLQEKLAFLPEKPVTYRGKNLLFARRQSHRFNESNS